MAQSDATLTHEAVEHGYADQAHMAREFRSLTGHTASDARRKGRGPFLSSDPQEG